MNGARPTLFILWREPSLGFALKDFLLVADVMPLNRPAPRCRMLFGRTMPTSAGNGSIVAASKMAFSGGSARADQDIAGWSSCGITTTTCLLSRATAAKSGLEQISR